MTSNEIVLAVIAALEKNRIDYMLVGSYSSNAFGVSRSTKDADFVLELGGQSISPLIDELKEILQFDTQMRLESITGTYRYVAHSLQLPFKVEFFMLSGDAHDRDRFARRRPEPFLNSTAILPRAEDVIVQKLRWFGIGRRAKDLEDVRNVIAVQFGKLDLPYIRRWCDLHGTREEFEELFEEARQFDP